MSRWFSASRPLPAVGQRERPDEGSTRATTVARLSIAVLLAAMGLGQLADVSAFDAILSTYHFGPGQLTGPLAAGLIVGELTGAALLLVPNPSSRTGGAWIALGVAVAWSVLAVQAFGRGLDVENCGCFGRFFGQELRWWVLLQDAWFVASTWWLARRPWGGGAR